MLSEEFFAAVCGPPLTSNTAIAKDVSIYHQILSPAHANRATFKKSATPVGGLAVSASHIFAGQHDRAYVHVYSRLRGGQEAFIPVPEKVRCVALAGDTLVIGTAEGRLVLWETLTGRLVTTPPCHVQGVSCLAATPFHILSGSDDSNVHVWSLPQLLALGDREEDPEPAATLARHRAAITSLAVGGSAAHRDTNLAVSASRDKTIVLWNYQTGEALRTLLLPAVPLCAVLDPVARALYVSTDDDEDKQQHIYAIELFGEKPLLGARGAEAASTAVSIATPFGTVPSDAGAASCLSVSYDGSSLLSGHPRGGILQWNLGDGDSGSTLPVQLSNLNAAVTNVAFVPPHLPTNQAAATFVVPPQTSVQTVVKPSQMGRDYAVTVRFDDVAAQGADAAFDTLVHQPGFPADFLNNAILAFANVEAKETDDADNSHNADASDLRRQNQELLEIVNEQQAMYQEALQKITELQAARP